VPGALVFLFASESAARHHRDDLDIAKVSEDRIAAEMLGVAVVASLAGREPKASIELADLAKTRTNAPGVLFDLEILDVCALIDPVYAKTSRDDFKFYTRDGHRSSLVGSGILWHSGLAGAVRQVNRIAILGFGGFLSNLCAAEHHQDEKQKQQQSHWNLSSRV
jgi:hypothetical protein